jgi:ketosteroid isomerase-like protein
MSEENVEIVRLAYERFNSGDVDGFLQLCATDFEFRDLPALPGSGVFIGHDAFRAWYAQLSEALEDVRFEAQEFIDAGGQIVVVNHATGSGRGSGAGVETHFSNVWTLSDGKALSAISYDTHAEALEAAGLSE